MKIPTITREAIKIAAASDGAADARQFMANQPELYNAVRDEMACYDSDLRTSFIAGISFALRCLEETEEPN